MSKRKNLFKISIVTSVLLLSSIAFSGSTDVMASNPINYKNMPEYATYESVIADAGATEGNLGISVALYDIDQDGIRELIISHGTCLADWVNDVYTLQDGKYVSMIGTVGDQGMFYTAPDGNGMYFVWGKLLAPGDIPTHGNSYDVEVTAPDGGVNMRCGAGVEYDKVLPDMIPNGTVLTVTQEAVASNGNSWGYTNYNGTYGWIALTQVTKYEEPTEGAPIPHTRYVINCNESITLRTNPDVNAAEICQIPLGTAVATFGDAGNGFISVYYQGSSGYCLASYLSAPVD